MRNHRRTRLANVALAAASGLSVLTLSAPADARQIGDEFQDEALIFPDYTVGDGWTTLANVPNTGLNDWGLDDDYCDDKLLVVGFADKSSDYGDPTRNFGVLMKHGYDDNDCLNEDDNCLHIAPF